MRIGVPKEIKNHEFRVGLTPAGVQVLTSSGHEVAIEAHAGDGSAFVDDEYRRSGAEILDTAEEVWSRSDMIVKVKEPIEAEFSRMREGQLVFTYLHLAAAPALAAELLQRKVNGVAYETIEPTPGHLPLLTPMSAVAGRMSVQAGAMFLERARGGKGILLGGVPGVQRGRVTVIGGGIVGSNAVRIAVGLGARVSVLDINPSTLAYLDDIYEGRIQTLYSDPHTIAESVQSADLLIGAVLVAGARAPRLVTEEMIKSMEPGSVVVDVSVDQGGCIETTKATTHQDPTYRLHDVIHYCVANMPGAVPRTSTFALTNTTMRYVKLLADNGLEGAVKLAPEIESGINTYRGTVPHPAVAEALNVDHTPFQ